jgi:predicted kinase
LEVEVIWVNVGLNKALEQNELRKGSQSYIPRQVIRRMFEQMEPVDLEHEDIDRVMVVSVDDKEQ